MASTKRQLPELTPQELELARILIVIDRRRRAALSKGDNIEATAA